MFFDKIIFICYYIMINLSNYTNIDVEEPKLLNIKLINKKCVLLLKQIEELKYNYQQMIMDRNNKEYTFIDGKKLVHIQPYTTKDVQNVNTCNAICSNRKDCYGFNARDNMSIFNKNSTTCDFISQGDIRNTGTISDSGNGTSLHIKIDDENLKTTKRVIDRLISEFHAACNKNMELIEQFKTHTPLYNTKTKTREGFDGDIEVLKSDIINNQYSLIKILNDANFLKRDYDKSYLHLTRNNIMLTLYTFVIIILIIIILIINPIKF